MRFALFNLFSDYVKQNNAARPANVRVSEAAAAAAAVKARADAHLAADLAKAVVLLTRAREITLAQIKDAQHNCNSTKPHNFYAIAMLQEYADAMNATLIAVNAAAANPNPALDMIFVKKCCDWVHESAAKASHAWDSTGRQHI